MKQKKNSWKLERASLHRKGSSRPKSNKYSKNDRDVRPPAYSRSKIWVGGHTRSDGTRIVGHFRVLSKLSSKILHYEID